MAYKVKWTLGSLSDLAEIGDHIGKEDPEAAYRVGSQILEHVKLLEGFPSIGPVYRWHGDGRIREILCQKYRIFY